MSEVKEVSVIETHVPENQITINIFGACVSRDLFPKDTEYVIQQYVSFTSPVSLYQPKNDRELTMEDLSCLGWGSAFAKRCMVLDHNKTSLAYLFQKKSDFLLLDFADVRMRMIKYGSNGYFTKTNLHVKNPKIFDKLFSGYTIEELPPLEKIKECIQKLCYDILEHYDVHQIILHEYYLVDEYLDKNGVIQKFKKLEFYHKLNTILKECYCLAKSILNGCYVITMPEHVVGYEKHIWGLHPLHYTKLYYSYAYAAVNHIIHTNSAVPESLKAEYSEALARQYQNAEYQKLLFDNKSLKASKDKLLCYSKTFVDLLKRYDETILAVKQKCEELHLKNVAFFGDFMISDVLAEILKKCDVQLDYIICNWDNHTASKVIPVGEKTYPKTDAIIICDIVSISKKMKYVEGKVDFPVYGIDEFISLKY